MKTCLLAIGISIGACWGVGTASAQPSVTRQVDAQTASTRERAAQMASKAVSFLRTKQDEKTGGWSINPKGPQYPAVTGLVVRGMLLAGADPVKDDAVARGVKFILSFQQPDGGIYDQILPNYNTAICLSALAKVNTPEAKKAIKPAQDFLKSLQFGEGAVIREKGAENAAKVGKEHPFYGAWGYGRHGRPDLSNTALALEALKDSGVEASDASFQRALVFLQRIQMHEKVNDAPYAKGSTQGGFIYATSVDKDKVGVGQSQAGTIEETLSDGTKASMLRCYGSMTYAGFKSYIYADLPRNDERVLLALDWIGRNYTLAENPGIGTDGMYYYFVTFARALDAAGKPTVAVRNADGSESARDWSKDLVDRLAELQNADGSFKTVDDRWLENDPVLITAYSLIALGHAGH